MAKFWTGIGTQGIKYLIPAAIEMDAERIAYHMASKGFIFRSGKAYGMDYIFESGVDDYMDLSSQTGLKEIYIPWEGFNLGSTKKGDYVLDEFMSKMARMILEDTGVCNAFEFISQGIQKLFCRNVFQVIGKDFIKSEVVIYYTKPKRNLDPQGGTAIAVMLARAMGIPTFNLWIPEERLAAFEFIGLDPYGTELLPHVTEEIIS